MTSLPDLPDDETERVIPATAVISAEGFVIRWTRAAQELLGYTAGDILHRPGADLFMPDDRGPRVWEGSDPPDGRDHLSDLTELRHRDGGAVLVRLEVSRLRDAGGAATWLLSATPATADTAGNSVLEPLVKSELVTMAVWDRGLRCVWLNEGARRQESVLPFLRVGRVLPERLRGFDGPTPTQLVRRVLDDGTPLIARETRWTPPDGRTEHAMSYSLFRVEAEDGRPLGVFLIAVDITGSMGRRRVTMLREAGARIGSTLDAGETAQEVAEVAVPALADFVTVDLTESVLPGEEPLERQQTRDLSIPLFRRAGVKSVHAGNPESLWPRGTPVYVPPSSPITTVLATGRSHFEPELDTSWMDPERARAARETGAHSLLLVPLRARGDVLGIVVFVRSENPEPFSRDDLVFAEELVMRAALSLDNARQYMRERTAALALQRHLLPRRLTGGRAVDVASQYRPSDDHRGVGGDWYDAIALPGSRVALVVGDVTGHGVNAAASMGRLRIAIRTLAHQNLPPDELLARLDNLYARQTDEDTGIDEFPSEALGGTCLYVVYDPATRVCTMATAGHPPPALVHPGGAVSFPSLPAGTPIGLGLNFYDSVDLELQEETLIALYTDGLIETRDCDLDTGMRRLAAALARATGTLQHISAQVVDAMVDESAEDDVTLLVARTHTI